MLTFDTKFAQDAATEAEVRAAAVREIILSGQLDHLNYKYHCGRLAGLLEAIELFDEVARKLQER